MIDTLLFDLDNTLLDFDKAEANAITRALGDVGISATNEMRDCYHKINLAQWKLLEQGKMTREFDIKVSPQEVAKHYQDYLGQGHYFIEGAEEVLQELSKRFRIYLVTNGTLSVQRGRLKSSGIEKYLQGVFISEEIGYNKPSIEYFEKCFSKIPDFKKENTVIIGDSLSSDIQGGINAGIKTIWFHRGQDLTEDPQPKPDYEINSLKFLLEMLK